MTILFFPAPLKPVPCRAGTTRGLHQVNKPGTDHMPAIIKEKFVTAAFLGLDKDLHGEIRSWITYASSTLSSLFKKSVNSSSTITIAQSIPWNAASILSLI